MSKGRYYQDSYVEFGLRSCSTKTEFNSNNVCLLCSKVFSNGCTRLLDLGVGMCIECITGLISRGVRPVRNTSDSGQRVRRPKKVKNHCIRGMIRYMMDYS